LVCCVLADTVRAKKMRQDGSAEFISASYTLLGNTKTNFVFVFASKKGLSPAPKGTTNSPLTQPYTLHLHTRKQIHEKAL